MWRRLQAAVLAAVLTTIPATAMALGSDKPEPNWKLWALATLGALLIVGPLAATGLYAWWMRRMRAGTARTWSYLMMVFIPAALSMGAYLWFVGSIPDLVVYVALAILLVMLIVASVGSRRRAL